MRTFFACFLLFCFAPATRNDSSTAQIRVLPPGETIITHPIVLYSGQSLIGSGSTLTLADGANCPVIIIGDSSPNPQFDTQNVYIADIKINGNKENQEFEGWGGDPNNGLEHAIRNNGITVRRASNIVIENVSVSGARSGGIVLERRCKNITILNCNLEKSQFDGLAAYESEQCFFSKLQLNDNEFAGASFDLSFNKNVMTDVVMRNNGHQGIFMRHSNFNQFNRIHVIGNGIHGVFLAKSELQNSDVKNCLFNNFVFFANPRSFQVNDLTCDGNILSNPRYLGESLISILK